jgi:hypothetical protein
MTTVAIATNGSDYVICSRELILLENTSGIIKLSLFVVVMASDIDSVSR